MKTRKAVLKRFRFTKSGKVLRRVPGQDHALAKKSSKKGRGMRRWVELSSSEAKAVKKILQY